MRCTVVFKGGLFSSPTKAAPGSGVLALRGFSMQTLRKKAEGSASSAQRHQGDGPASSRGRVSMGTEQGVVVISRVMSPLKLRLWVSIQHTVPHCFTYGPPLLNIRSPTA